MEDADRFVALDSSPFEGHLRPIPRYFRKKANIVACEEKQEFVKKAFQTQDKKLLKRAFKQAAQRGQDAFEARRHFWHMRDLRAEAIEQEYKMRYARSEIFDYELN